MKTFLKRAWTEIHLDRLKDNFTELKKLTDETHTQVACVVKANAYGHDDENIVPFLEGLGAKFFLVSNIKEAEKSAAAEAEAKFSFSVTLLRNMLPSWLKMTLSRLRFLRNTPVSFRKRLSSAALR